MTVQELYNALGSLIDQGNGNLNALLADTEGGMDLYLITDLEIRKATSVSNDLVDVLVIM